MSRRWFENIVNRLCHKIKLKFIIGTWMRCASNKTWITNRHSALFAGKDSKQQTHTIWLYIPIYTIRAISTRTKRARTDGTSKQVTNNMFICHCVALFFRSIHNVYGISITNRNMHSYMPALMYVWMRIWFPIKPIAWVFFLTRRAFYRLYMIGWTPEWHLKRFFERSYI